MEVRCPFCQATLQAPGDLSFVRCVECLRQVQVEHGDQAGRVPDMPQASAQPAGGEPDEAEQSGRGTPTAWPLPMRTPYRIYGQAPPECSPQDETSLLRIPDDYEAARLRATRAAFEEDYEVICPLGQGGMGAVYKAMQLHPKRVVVLKLMLNGKFSSRRNRLRFEQEVQAVARLKHPNIVAVYECGEVGGQPYFSMEYVDGCNVREHVRRHRVDKRGICALVLKVGRALAYAHSQGVVHRDVKPNNVLVDSDGEPRLVDFGLARVLGRPNAIDMALTQTGEVMGTPSYMSPEQASGRPEDVDGRSDTYSLGVLIYELLTNELPYRIDHGRPLESLRIVREYTPRRPSTLNSRIDSDLEAITMRCLEKDREDRYQSVEELNQDLEHYLRGEPVKARPCTSLHYLRKMVWRNRNVVVPMGTAVLIALTLTGVFIWQTEARDRAAQERAERVEQERQELIDILRDLQNQGGNAGPGHVDRPPGTLDAEREEERLRGLIRQLKFREARERLAQVRTLAERQQAHDVSARMDELSRRLAEDAWQRVAECCRRGRGGALALDRFVREFPGSPRGPDARRLLAEFKSLVQFSDWPFDADEAERRRTQTAHVLDVPAVERLRLDSYTGLPLMLVPAGEFQMGAGGADAPSSERPLHRVRISNPFYLGATEITRGQYEVVMGKMPEEGIAGELSVQSSRFPVAVSYEAAQAFCQALSRRTKRIVRLPTEAEWEYACRAGSPGRYGQAVGGEAKHLAASAWWRDNAPNGARPTGLKRPGTWGLFDMHGNTWEWCQDWYDADYYRHSPASDPQGPAAGAFRVLRGGSWHSVPEELGCARRNADLPGRSRPMYGFRICVQVFTEPLEAATAGDAAAAAQS